MPLTKVCQSHVALQIEQVLDAHLDWTQALLHCTACDEYLLGEMIDMTARERLYRLTAVSRAGALAMLKSIARGSCDLQRAQTELNYLGSTGQPHADVLLIDRQQQRCLVWPPEQPLPRENWRVLACDGKLIATLKRAHNIRS